MNIVSENTFENYVQIQPVWLRGSRDKHRALCVYCANTPP